ncbi:MAG: SAM-dependent DNA methyltransferase [Lentisphaerae bacterium]|nr:SAM-dependent DNA methyltransferase [Lentisphaerota bacterium]
MAKATGANLGFEDKLWAAADKLRGTMDAAEYKHVVLGLIFLKYISDAFMEMHARLSTDEYADPEDRDEYLAENVFWVPPEARWPSLQKSAKQASIGQLVDDAMKAIERDNPQLKGVLPKDYARPALDKTRLGELIDLIATIGLGDAESRKQDILGRVYEYFLARFAEKEGKGGGEFYTPQCVVRLLVEMLEPFKGRVYDPCCGSGGMFVSAAKFVTKHASANGSLSAGAHAQAGGKSKAQTQRQISIFGQESNYTTWRLALMNLAIRGIDAHIEWGDSFLDDKHKDLRADFILANPPFNMEDWGFSKVADDVRWKYGTPPKGGERKQKDGSIITVDGGNANYAWIQHFLYHLAPDGTAGFVLANGSMSSNSSGEGDIRKAIIEADLVDCMIALPGQLFYTTSIPVCLWFLTRQKTANRAKGYRVRCGETLFIDARKLGTLIDRTHRELSDEDIARITRTYHAWRSEGDAYGAYADQPGFCGTATIKEIKEHGYVLTPGRYVGTEAIEDDGIPFEEKMTELTAALYQQMAESTRLDAAIRANMEALGYGE